MVNGNCMEKKLEKIHSIYIVGIIIITIISIYILITLPHGRPFPILEKSFFLFGLGLNTSILLWTIGGYLLARWFKTGKKNPSLIIWSFSFFIYSVTFIAHVFKALGFSFADENASVYNFLAYRWGMIVWAAGILFGALKILTENKKLQILPSSIVLIIGFLLFIIGLFIVKSNNPIETTMYLFLFTIWIPICFTMAYIFFYYGYKSMKMGPKLISLGFLGIMITYMQWAPWHFSDVVYIYFIWYILFSLSLIPILLGFIIMSFEER